MELSPRQRVPCENTGSFATLALAFTNFTKFARAGTSPSDILILLASRHHLSWSGKEARPPCSANYADD